MMRQDQIGLQQVRIATMGNNNNASQFQKIQFTCHPGLAQSTFQPETQLLYSLAVFQESFLIWQKLLYPLMNKRHLFTPTKFIPLQTNMQIGCWTEQQENHLQTQYKKIYYQPFVYTLDKEIVSRRSKNTYFREPQIWKLINYISQAILQWSSVYPNEKLGILCPYNIVLNSSGQIKVVNRLSFYNNQYNTVDQVYCPPETKENPVIKYNLNPHRDALGIQLASIFSLGVILLEVISLHLHGESLLQIQDKQILMQKADYSIELKELVNVMINTNPVDRPSAQFLCSKVRQKKTKLN